MIKGDKIKLVKPMGAFTNVGEVCEVTDIREDGSIWFRFGGVHLGCMSYDEYEKYFESVKEKVKREWSEWKCLSYDFNFDYHIADDTLHFRDSIGDLGDIWYRDNGKRVQVRIETDEKYLCASSSCNKDDIFSFPVGMKLALKRLFSKVLAYLAECDANNM